MNFSVRCSYTRIISDLFDTTITEVQITETGFVSPPVVFEVSVASASGGCRNDWSNLCSTNITFTDACTDVDTCTENDYHIPFATGYNASRMRDSYECRAYFGTSSSFKILDLAGMLRRSDVHGVYYFNKAVV